MQKLEVLFEGVDHINEIVGSYVSYLMIPIALTVGYEVVVRYIFNNPTIWSWDVAVYMGGLIIVLGAGYVQSKSAHISVDIFVANLSRRHRAAIDFFTAPIFIFAIIILVEQGAEQAWHSILINEHKTSLLSPPVWPLRIAIPVGGFLLLLQMLAKFVRDFRVVFMRRNE